MSERVRKARVKCPYCNKTGVRLTIKVRKGGGVEGTLSKHGGLYADAKTGKALTCSGSGKKIENRHIPPMSEWT